MITRIRRAGDGISPLTSRKKTAKSAEQPSFSQSLDAIGSPQEHTREQPHEHKSSRQYAQAWGERSLNELEQIRMDLLQGTISHSRLLQLQQAVQDSPLKSSHEKLNQLIAEINLRLEVEIAKYSATS